MTTEKQLFLPDDRTASLGFAAIRSLDFGDWDTVGGDNHFAAFINSPIPTPTGDLAVNYSGGQGLVVGSMLVTYDETLAGQRYTVGASVGQSTANLRMFLPFSVYISGMSVSPQNSGLGEGFALAAESDPLPPDTTWAYYLDGPNGKLTIKHTDQTSSHAITPCSLSGDINTTSSPLNSTGATRVALVNSTKTLKIIQALHPLRGEINKNGSITTEIVGCSGSWDSAAGEYTLNTPPVAHPQGATVTMREGGFIPFVKDGSEKKDSMIVQFWDIETNSLYTGTDVPKSNFARSGEGPTPWTNAIKATLDGLPVKARAQDIRTGASGNFWMMNTMVREENPV